MTKSKLILIITSLLAFGFLLACLGLWLLGRGAQTIDKLSFEYHTPNFSQSDLNMALQTHPRLYYKTDKPYKVGDRVTHLEIISVFSPNQGDNFEPRVATLDNAVDGVGKGYIYFDFPPMASDCIATYIDGALTKYHITQISRLPTPSDNWLCAGYDFKNRTFKYKPEHTLP